MVERHVIQMTWKQAISTAFVFGATLIGGAWLVAANVFGGLRSDVGDIRADIRQLTQEDSTVRGLLSGTDAGLRDQIGEIREISARNEMALRSIESDIGEMKGELQGLRVDFRTVFARELEKKD